MTNLYLIRHGDYIEDLENGKYQDLGLTAEGVRQGEALRDRIALSNDIRADVLIASTLRRAQESAHILAPALGQPIISDESFEEWRVEDGSLDPDAFNARWAEVLPDQRPFYRWQEGFETSLEFVVRVQQALNRVTREYVGNDIVIVTHGGIIQASFVHFFGISATSMPGVSIGNATVTQWTLPPNRQKWVLMRYNDSLSHI